MFLLARRDFSLSRRQRSRPADSAVFSGTPAQAQERLAQISTTPELRDKVLAGSPALLREWQELTRVVVEAGESTPTGNIETTDIWLATRPRSPAASVPV